MRSRTVVALVTAGVIGGAGAGALTAAVADSGSATASAKGPAASVFFGVLLGKNEIGTDGKKRAGDLDGRGSASATIDTDTNELCFGLTAKDIAEPVAAHIHKGTKGENGPIVVPLTPPSAGDPGASSGCVAIDAALAKALAKNPRKYYWNIHTADFPGGAIRGQVSRKSN
jgi:hypothetical protein